MRSTMVREHTVSLSNGETLVAAPYMPHDIDAVSDAVAWFNNVRPSWMKPLSMSITSTRPTAWMR